MSIGTGLTVSSLAILSVYSRKAALRLAAVLPSSAPRFALLVNLVGLVGGIAILVFGALLFQSV